MKKITTFFALLIFSLSTYASPYEEQIEARPMPTTQEERNSECAWLRSEIARQQGLATYGASIASSPSMAAGFRALAQRNIAVLNTRAANLNCAAAFSSQTVIEKQKSGYTEECFNACRKYTNRSSEQCFDSCNK